MPKRCFYCAGAATADGPGIPAWAVDQVGLAGESLEHLVASGEPLERPGTDPVDSIPYGTPSHAELGSEQPVDRLHQAIEAAIEEQAELTLSDYAARSLCAACAKAMQALDEGSASAAGAHDRQQATRVRCRRAAGTRRLGGRQAYAVLAVEGKGEGVPPWHRQTLRGTRQAARGRVRRLRPLSARIMSARSPHACSFPSATTAATSRRTASCASSGGWP